MFVYLVETAIVIIARSFKCSILFQDCFLFIPRNLRYALSSLYFDLLFSSLIHYASEPYYQRC